MARRPHPPPWSSTPRQRPDSLPLLACRPTMIQTVYWVKWVPRSVVARVHNWWGMVVLPCVGRSMLHVQS